jgi:hypothetical protein
MIDEIYLAIVDKQNLSDNKCGLLKYLREFTGIKKNLEKYLTNYLTGMITVRKGLTEI